MKFAIIIVIIAAAVILILVLMPQQKPEPIIDYKKSADMILTSPAFQNNGPIPAKYSCDGGNINPELQIQNTPKEAKSLALIMDDPDATGGRTFTHWIVWNIDPKTAVIKEESTPPSSIEGMTDFGRSGYGGPCPPRGSKPHRYFFKLYALDVRLDLPAGASKSSLESEIKKHLLAQTELVGLYGRK